MGAIRSGSGYPPLKPRQPHQDMQANRADEVGDLLLEASEVRSRVRERVDAPGGCYWGGRSGKDISSVTGLLSRERKRGGTSPAGRKYHSLGG